LKDKNWKKGIGDKRCIIHLVIDRQRPPSLWVSVKENPKTTIEKDRRERNGEMSRAREKRDRAMKEPFEETGETRR